jgi:cytochrome c oxidase subunit 2
VILISVFLVSLGVFWRPRRLLFLDSVVLEVVWTLLPIFILVSLAYPSIYLLCYQDRIKSGLDFNIKVIGHQWS